MDQQTNDSGLLKRMEQRKNQLGQALVEYALILAMVAIALGVAIAATGPAIGNVFSNTVYNLLGQTLTPVDLVARGGPTAFWLTVTWVASQTPVENVSVAINPGLNTQVPPATSVGGDLSGASQTPTLTPSQTLAPSDTPQPSETPVDFTFTAPFYDPVENPAWWRINTDVMVDGMLWEGTFYPNTDLSEPANQSLKRRVVTDEINYNWGSATPISGWGYTDFSVRWVRGIYLPADTQIRFKAQADDGARLFIDGAAVAGIDDWNAAYTEQEVTVTVLAGYHTLTLEYVDFATDARLAFFVDDIGQPFTENSASCDWIDTEIDTRSNTLIGVFDEYRYGDFPTSSTCYLELRGSIDLTPLTNPQLAFWDVWDLNGGSQTWVEVSVYDPIRTNLVWERVNLHSGAIANYRWTRQVVDLSNVNGTDFTDETIALRFGFDQSADASGQRRWNIDDVEISETTYPDRSWCAGDIVTCGTYWDLNSAGQSSDFITTGRWSLTGNLVHGGSGMSYEDSAQYSGNFNYYRDTAGERIYYVEPKGLIDFNTGLPATTILADGTGGDPDADGDDGFPLFSFWYAYKLNTGDSIEVQYSRDAYGTRNGETWTTLTTVVAAASGIRSDLNMAFHEAALSLIPNWDTLPFRIRVAMIVNSDNATENGLWLDDIYIERQADNAFSDYPFSENGELGANNWLMSGQWGITSESVARPLQGFAAFADSPSANYISGVTSTMELRDPFDLNNDTPEQLVNGPNTGGAAINPMLTFWWWRDLDNGDEFYVDVDIPYVGWTPVWAATGFSATTDDQFSWERAQIDLSAYVNPDPDPLATDDDDILIRFRFVTNGTNSDDGIYIDQITLSEHTTSSFDLSSGTYSDDFESGSLSANWVTGEWESVSFDAHSGSRSMHENGTDTSTYRTSAFNGVELSRIIDLTSVNALDIPTMYFWYRYKLGSNHFMHVQVAQENPAQTTQGYELLSGWELWGDGDLTSGSTSWLNDGRQTSWQTIWRISGAAENRLWNRAQIDLSAYAGQRIRIRFATDAFVAGTGETGWLIDDLSLTLPGISGSSGMFLQATDLDGLITEGNWGLAADYYRGSAGNDDLGENWTAYWFDCKQTNDNQGSPRNCIGPIEHGVRLDNITNSTDPGISSSNVSMDDLPSTVLPNIAFDFGDAVSQPPSASGTTWNNDFMARFVKVVTLPTGIYSLTTVTDDGARVKIEQWDPAGNGGFGAASALGANGTCTNGGTWNIINDWVNQTAAQGINVGTCNITVAGDYRLTFEYYEDSGTASVVLNAGSNSFSFGDSPGTSVDATPRSSSSLTVYTNLTLGSNPVLEFYTLYDLDNSNIALVEVSTDGGFTWSTSGLSDIVGSMPITGTSQYLDTNNWEYHQIDLSALGSQPVMIRFRLNNLGADNTGGGWWLDDIQLLTS